MQLFGYDITVDMLALALFLLCFFISIYSRERARKSETPTGKGIRSKYRKSWVEYILKKGDDRTVVEVVRNSILVSTALMTAVIISFGFVLAKVPALDVALDVVAGFRILAMMALLAYAFFMLVLEGRTLIYLPVVFGTSEKLIESLDNMKKVDYVAKLLHESFDHFSNAIRALVFIVALLVWFYNVYLFMLFTVILTFAMVHEDYGRRSEIMLF
ncbi:DUF599 domain-containing protein [Candidatus Micrarchaeota archaeon]|nr:DUF599 domain-containing protein [Candidatus Micrarchaeota archaeon]